MTEIRPAPDLRAVSAPVRWLLHALTVLCLVLALVGVVFPIMPTVPFLVAAAWAAARSSPRLHAWLMAHKRFGPWLRDWNEAGIVPRKAKWFSTAMMAGSAVGAPFLVPVQWAFLLVLPGAGMLAVLVWLWQRPERR